MLCVLKGDLMGTFRYSMEVGRSDAGPFEQVEAVVDTGATFSQFPRSLLARLGVTPVEQREFTLADSRRIVRDIAIVTVRLEGRTRPTVCVVGEDGGPSLLGAVTLETFGLAADPVNRRLIQAELYLFQCVPPKESRGQGQRPCPRFVLNAAGKDASS